MSDDYFAVEEDSIRGIESVLTIVDGTIVHAANEFSKYNPDLPPVSPDWSPVAKYGGNNNIHGNKGHSNSGSCQGHMNDQGHTHMPILGADGRAWQSGCSCSA